MTAKKKESFIRSTFIYSIGVFGSKVILFALVPIYSFFLSREELGEYDLVLVSVTLITPLITIQVADGVYRFLLQAEKERQKANVLITGGLTVLGGILLFSLLGSLLNQFIRYDNFDIYLLVQGASCLFIFIQQASRGLGKNTLYALMGVCNAVLVILLSAYFLLVAETGVRGLLIALATAQFLAILLVLSFSSIPGLVRSGSFVWALQRDLLKYSWPLLPNAISWWLIDLGNRYIIFFFLGDEFNGIYAIAARYSGIIALVNSIFILTWQDRAIANAGTVKEKKNEVQKIFTRFFKFELSIILVLAAAAHFLVEWTTDPAFHEAALYLPILLMAAGLSAFCAYFGALYLRDKNTLRIFTTTLTGGVVNMVFSILFIHKLGLYAVAVGSVAGFLLTFLLRFRTYPQKVPVGILILFLAVFLTSLYTQHELADEWKWGMFIFTGLIFMLINKELFLSLKSKISTSKGSM